jgi:hypothetical protein
MNRIVKRISAKFQIWRRSKNVIPTYKETVEYEQMCASVCRKLMRLPKTTLGIAPLSDKRYIINKELGMFVVLIDNRVELTNHVYHYVVNLDRAAFKKLCGIFDNKLEKIRNEYEEEIKSQIEHSLKGILKKLE